MILTFDNVIAVLDDLAKAYRQTNGLDGAHDKALVTAEAVINKFRDIQAQQAKYMQQPDSTAK